MGGEAYNYRGVSRTMVFEAKILANKMSLTTAKPHGCHLSILIVGHGCRKLYMETVMQASESVDFDFLMKRSFTCKAP